MCEKPNFFFGDLLQLRFAKQVRVYPNGTDVAFEIRRIDEQNDSYKSAVWIGKCLQDQSSSQSQIAARDSLPDWLSDEKLLAFLSEQEGKGPHIYIIRRDGEEPQQRTNLTKSAITVH